MRHCCWLGGLSIYVRRRLHAPLAHLHRDCSAGKGVGSGRARRAACGSCRPRQGGKARHSNRVIPSWSQWHSPRDLLSPLRAGCGRRHPSIRRLPALTDSVASSVSCPTPADHSPRRTALRFLLSADPLQLIEKKLTERPSREDAQAKNILQKGASSSGRPLAQRPSAVRAAYVGACT